MQIQRFMQLISEEAMLSEDAVQPDSDLAGSLGMQSIDILQVIRRVEDQVGKPIVAVDISQARTVEQLYDALMQGLTSPRLRDLVPSGWTPTESTLLPHERAMDEYMPLDPLAEATTLVQMLASQATDKPDALAMTFKAESVTFAELQEGALRVAAGLREAGVQAGDRVILVMPNSVEFFHAFYGVQQLRAIAVPVYHVPQPERIARIARLSGATAIVTLRPFARPISKRLDALLEGTDITFLDTAAMAECAPATVLPVPEPDDIAMLQYTSGTTGDPKGVMLTHRALMANIRQIIVRLQFSQDDVFVSWLPVYHDMGLIMMTMCPLYLGARLALLPTALSSDAWLGTLDQVRGTVTAAPDFAYRFVLRTCREPEQYDLSALRMSLVAAEPVRSATIDRFERAFSIPGRLRPAYGLAESCVGVTFYDYDEGAIKTDRNGTVCVGRPLDGIELSIRRDGVVQQPTGVVGEVCFKSPSQTLGYYRNDKRTRELLTRDGYVRTGDLGYIDTTGQLYIVDRQKNVIIVAGRTLSPREIEEIAEQAPEVVLAMALGIDEGDELGEQVHIFVETRRRNEPSTEQQRIARDVRDRVQQQLGVRTHRVHILEPNNIPRTYNGKLQYGVMRERLRPSDPAFDTTPTIDPSSIFKTKRVHVIDESFRKGIELGLCHNQLDADQTLDGRSFRAHGDDFVNFASCSYLGLEIDPRVKMGIVDATSRQGASFIISRAYASSPLFERFENKLSQIMDAPVVVTPSTTLGTLSFMQTFINEGDIVVLDESVHNSVQLTAATVGKNGGHVETIPHNDLDALVRLCEQQEVSGKRLWYCIDGIYSMHGDFAPIHDIIALLDKYPNLYCYADDAHGMSMLGTNGRGYVLGEQESLHPKMVVAVSLSKAFGMGTGGAVVLPHEEWRRMLRTCGPTLIFSTPIPPPMLGAGIALADIHLSDEIEQRQAELARNITFFRRCLSDVGLKTPSDPRSPVQFIHVGSDLAAANVAADVVQQGYFMNLAAFPAVAPGAAGLRLTLTTLQTEADIVQLMDAIRTACERHGVLRPAF